MQNFTAALLEVLRGPLRVLFYVCSIIGAGWEYIRSKTIAILAVAIAAIVIVEILLKIIPS